MTTAPGYDAMPIVGYCDPLSVPAGGSVDVMVSTTAETFTAELVRLRHGDPHPDGPGLRCTRVPTAVDGTYDGRLQSLPLGSYVVADGNETERPGSFTLHAWVWPSLHRHDNQGVVTAWSEPDRRGYGMWLGPDGDLCLTLDDRTYRTGVALRERGWSSVAVGYDSGQRQVRLRQTPLRPIPNDPTVAEVVIDDVAPASVPGVPFVVGGHVSAAGPVGRYDGKIDGPQLFGRSLDHDELRRLTADEHIADGLRSAWRLGTGIDEVRVHDAVGNRHGTAVNSPTAGVTGHDWDGAEITFAAAPDQYDALFFHSDDLDDARWEPAFTFAVPEDLPSGIYGFRLRTPTGDDVVPLVVTPPSGVATNDVALLAPTMSWLAYANDHSAPDNPVAAGGSDPAPPGRAERFATATGLTGLYDHHPDGSGVCFSSWRKPIVNMRPDYHLPLVQSAHQFPADLHLVDWLEEQGCAYDTISDHHLHSEGTALLQRYRVLVTGSHPEYWSAAMLDALESYLAGGGRLMYLGGNGFYWVTSVSPSRPHLIEVRRGRRGTGTWRSEPGEDQHATTGEPGGLWRDRGRAPQRLVGVGMAAQGFDRAIAYEAADPADLPAVNDWVFEGVDRRLPIGSSGLMMGGAAGLEVDRMDHALGTPVNAVRLASATGFSDSYQHVVEEVASSDSRQGGTVCDDVRADLVYVDLPGGGAVFSTGSISWCGALSHNGYDNAVSAITGNVLRRFSADGPPPPSRP